MRLLRDRQPAGGRKWAWHPHGRAEYEQLRFRAAYLWGTVTLKLERLTGPGRAEQCRTVRGRVRRHQFQIDLTWVTVLFVSRRDGGGLGGLHLTATRDPAVPEEAYDLARSRLSDMSEW